MNGKPPHEQAKPEESPATRPAPEPAADTAVEAKLDAALQHHQAGDLDQAEALYRSVLDAQPENFVALHLRGVAAHQAGGSDLAVDLVGKAIALKPDYAEAHYNLGRIFCEIGRLDEGVAAYRKVISLEPDNAEAHSNLGNALDSQGKLDEAVAAYRKAVTLEPNYAEAHSNLGDALTKLDKLDEAVAACRRAIALKPDLAEAHNNLGNALAAQRKLEEATASYQQAIAVAPDYAEAHNNLGTALSNQGRIGLATASYQKAVALKPGMAEAHNNLGVAFKRQERSDEAAACFRRAIEIRPDYIAAHHNYAKVHSFQPDDPEIEALDELLRLETTPEVERNQVRFALGKVHDDLGRYAEAFSHFSTANQEMARRVEFDAAAHRLKMGEIMDTFRDRRGAAAGRSGHAGRVPVFVVGMSRSGKTLVETLLAQHDDTCGIGESLEWGNAMGAVMDKYAASMPYPQCMGFLSDASVKEIGKIYLGKLIDYLPESRVLINTLSSNFEYIGLILEALPTAKILYCHRDPIDNCLLVYCVRYTDGNEYSYDLNNLASYYADYQGLMAYWRRLYRGRILSVRYEDLVRDPSDLGARLYRFCGLDHDRSAVSHEFTTDQIGRWKNYEPYIGPLRQALDQSAAEWRRQRHGRSQAATPSRMPATEPRTRRQPVVTAPVGQAAPITDTTERELIVAHSYLQASQFKQAAAICQNVLEDQPNHPEALHLLGVATFSTGKSAAAIELIGTALSARPDYPAAHNSLGNILAAQGKYDEAIASYERSVALDPGFAEGHSNLATMLCQQNKLEESIASFQKAIALKPDMAEAHNNLGFALQKQGDSEEAKASIEKALALRPDYAEAHSNLGHTLCEQGKLEEAIAVTKKAIALKPKFPEAHHNLGIALKEYGWLDEAAASFQEAIALMPDYADAHSSLGTTLKRTGRLDEAVASFKRAIEIEPGNVGARFGHAHVHEFFAGDPEIAALEELLGQENLSRPQKNRLRFALGKAHDDIGRYAEAFSFYEAGNRDTARRLEFDANRHRTYHIEIKETFGERKVAPDEGVGDSGPIPVFVVGTSRSGKTLVESLLAQHEDVYGGSESYDWAHAMGEVFERHSIPQSSPKCMGLFSDEQIREIGELYTEKMVRRHPNSRLYVNTAPGNYQFIGMIPRALPNYKIIYCNREPLDNCLYMYFLLYRHGNEHAFDLRNIGLYYTAYQDLMAHWQRLYADRILAVRYEELVRDPDQVGERIYRFCGLDYDRATVRHTFTADEIGHWKNYEAYLGPLRETLDQV